MAIHANASELGVRHEVNEPGSTFVPRHSERVEIAACLEARLTSRGGSPLRGRQRQTAKLCKTNPFLQAPRARSRHPSKQLARATTARARAGRRRRHTRRNSAEPSPPPSRAPPWPSRDRRNKCGLVDRHDALEHNGERLTPVDGRISEPLEDRVNPIPDGLPFGRRHPRGRIWSTQFRAGRPPRDGLEPRIGSTFVEEGFDLVHRHRRSSRVRQR